MDFSTLKTQDQAYVAHTYGRFDLAIVRGQGAQCTDINGKEYIDFTAGIGVNVLGYCNEHWQKAVSEQAATLSHTSNLYYTLPGPKLAQTLCERSGMKRVFFGNSGAEANEGMIKAARKYGEMRRGPACSQIITLINSFHGRTIATLKATGQDGFHAHFGPFPDGFTYVPANDFDALVGAIGPNTCAIMMEMVQGEGGVIPLEQDFVQKVAALCKEQDVLLLVDEVQTGIGRTGSFFSYQQFDILPDIVSSAKGLGGGLPIGAVLLGEKCKDVLVPGDHGSTFGMNPVVCAGANAILDQLDDALYAEVKRKSAHIFAAVQRMPHVQSVTGLGLMIGVQFDDGVAGVEVVKQCIERGVIFLTAKAKLRMLPPLNITDAQIDAGLAVLNEILTNWEETK